MTKRYKLLKDLPNIKAGTIYTKYDEERYICSYPNSLGYTHPLAKDVENNPEWFEEVVEEDEQTITNEMLKDVDVKIDIEKTFPIDPELGKIRRNEDYFRYLNKQKLEEKKKTWRYTNQTNNDETI